MTAKQFLSSLPAWDGVPRLEAWLAEVEALSPAQSQQIRNWLAGATASCGHAAPGRSPLPLDRSGVDSPHGSTEPAPWPMPDTKSLLTAAAFFRRSSTPGTTPSVRWPNRLTWRGSQSPWEVAASTLRAVRVAVLRFFLRVRQVLPLKGFWS